LAPHSVIEQHLKCRSVVVVVRDAMANKVRHFTRNSLIAMTIAVAVSMMLLGLPPAFATQTQGHIYHQIHDWPTGLLVGQLDYYTTANSHWNGARYIIDQSWDAVSWWTWPLVYYNNVVHNVQNFIGGYNEFARGHVEFDCGLGMWTPWGVIPIQQEHKTGYIWVYASGYWTCQWY
jgi:hypothetical protein